MPREVDRIASIADGSPSAAGRRVGDGAPRPQAAGLRGDETTAARMRRRRRTRGAVRMDGRTTPSVSMRSGFAGTTVGTNPGTLVGGAGHGAARTLALAASPFSRRDSAKQRECRLPRVDCLQREAASQFLPLSRSGYLRPSGGSRAHVFAYVSQESVKATIEQRIAEYDAAWREQTLDPVGVTGLRPRSTVCRCTVCHIKLKHCSYAENGVRS
jgi:hypothetical protein